MGKISLLANSAFRDFVTDGVPSSGPNAPSKLEIRGVFAEVDSEVAATQTLPAFSQLKLAANGFHHYAAAVAANGLKGTARRVCFPTTAWLEGSTVYVVLGNFADTSNVGDINYGNGLGGTFGQVTYNGTICWPGMDDVVGEWGPITVQAGGLVVVPCVLSATITPGSGPVYLGEFANPSAGAGVPLFGAIENQGEFSQGPNTGNPDFFNAALGEGAELSSGATDKTAALSTLVNVAGNLPCLHGPLAVLTMQPASQPVVVVSSDSENTGFKGGPDGSNCLSPFGRAFNGLVPILNLSVSGKQAAADAGAGFSGTGYEYATSARQALMVLCGATHVIVQLGANDIVGEGASAATIEGYLTTIYKRYAAMGLVVAGATLIPETQDSTDVGIPWLAAHQTVLAGETDRTALNTWIRTVPAPLSFIVDACPTVESAPGSGIWADNLTPDGIHPLWNAQQAIAASVPVAEFQSIAPASGVGYADTFGLGVKSVQTALDSVLGVGDSAGVTVLADADHPFNPYGEGRKFYDSGVLTADRNLTLLASGGPNAEAVRDGYEVEVSRFGAGDAYHRKVYQADGATLIASIAAGSAAGFVYSVALGHWYQTR